MPLLWRIPDDYPKEQIGFYDRDRGPDRFLFLNGSRLREALETRPRVKFDCSKVDLCRNDCIWTDARIPIVSKRLKNFLSEKVPNQAQFFDVDISTADGDVNGYYLFNASNIVEVIDIELSKYKLIPGTKEVMSFSALHTSGARMDDMSVGRDRVYLSYLFVGDALANEFKAAGFLGASLVDPSSA